MAPKIDCFEEHYEKYEDWFNRFEYVYRTELKAVRHFVPEKGAGLEIGIGTGRFAEPLGIRTGVEPSPKMRRLAEKKGLTVFDGVAEALPFEDGAFDYTLMVTTICFVSDIKKSFEEARRVLKNGGAFIAGFVDRESQLGQKYLKIKHQNVFYKDAEFYSTEEILSLLKTTGFVSPETIQTVYGDLPEIGEVQDFEEGYGQGGFVVVRAYKA